MFYPFIYICKCKSVLFDHLKISLSPEWSHFQVYLKTIDSVLLTVFYAKCTRKDKPTITEQINLNLSIDVFIVQ